MSKPTLDLVESTYEKIQQSRQSDIKKLQAKDQEILKQWHRWIDFRVAENLGQEFWQSIQQ